MNSTLSGLQFDIAIHYESVLIVEAARPSLSSVGFLIKTCFTNTMLNVLLICAALGARGKTPGRLLNMLFTFILLPVFIG